jgi:hypothetical protein
MSDYSAHFLIRGKDVSQHASDYLSGLLGTYRRKNLECIHGDIPESNYQAMQQFVSDSPWSQDKLMAQVAAEANGILGGNRHSALLIDESSFVKKGDCSVGVQRQYCGRLGKKENCQLGAGRESVGGGFPPLSAGVMGAIARAMREGPNPGGATAASQQIGLGVGHGQGGPSPRAAISLGLGGRGLWLQQRVLCGVGEDGFIGEVCT